YGDFISHADRPEWSIADIGILDISRTRVEYQLEDRLDRAEIARCSGRCRSGRATKKTADERSNSASYGPEEEHADGASGRAARCRARGSSCGSYGESSFQQCGQGGSEFPHPHPEISFGLAVQRTSFMITRRSITEIGGNVVACR